MPATRSQQQAGSASLAPFAFFVGIIGIGVAAWKGYPGVPVLLAALVISAILEKPPLMTGRKVPGRGAQPAGEKEEDLQASYQMWRGLRWRLLVPTLDWLPGWPPRASWFAAVAAAWTSIALPVMEPVYALANPPAMFIVVAVMTAAMRRKSGSPGLRLNTFPFRPLALLSGLAGAGAGAAAGKYGPPKIEEAVPGLEFGPPMVIVSGLAFLGFLAGLYPAWSNKALARWRAVVRARREWRPRWESLKFDPLPQLIDSVMVGDWQIDDFIATSVGGAAEVRDKADKVATTVGGGVEVTVLTRPNEAGGQPLPGTIHPQKFAIVTAPSGNAPDLTDPGTPADIVQVVIDVLMRRTCIALGLPPAVVTGVEGMHADGATKALWRVTADWPDGPGWEAARSGKVAKRVTDGGSNKFGDRFMAVSGMPAVVDHRRDGGSMFVGAVDDDMPLKDESVRPIVLMLAAEDQWRARWEILKVDPAPDLYEVRSVGTWTVYEFETLGAESSETMRLKAPKIAPTVGAGVDMTLIPRPNDVDGVEVTGTIHPRKFAIVISPSGDIPDIGDPATSPEVLDTAVRTWVQQVCDALKVAPVMVTAVTAMHTDDSPVAMWQVNGAWPEGPGWTTARALGFAPMLGGGTRLDAAIDHRSPDGGHLFLGAATDDLKTIDPKFPDALGEIFEEDWWNGVWTEVLKQGVNPPTIAPRVSSEDTYQGKRIKHTVFQVRKGMDPMEHGNPKAETKLASTLNAAPFVSVTGWTPPSVGRKATRHATAFCVTWSSEPGLPTAPEKVVSASRPTPAYQWLLASHVNHAFDAARLARPEVVAVRALTPEPSGNRRFAEPSVWEITLRLYGGVTLADVRGAADRMRQALATPWLRVDAAADGCIIYAGARPSSVEIVSVKDRDKVVALDWDQAWLKSKLDIPGALTPVLAKVEPVETNPQVTVLTFDLPQGASIPGIVKILPTLRTSTGNDFIELDRERTTAARLVLQVSERDPMPSRVELIMDGIPDGSLSIPLAVNVAGVPDNWNMKESPHLGVIGGSGSGKSVAMTNLLTGVLLAGHDAIVVDPVKGAADFKYATSFALATADTWQNGAAAMRWAYQEVLRRKDLNKQHGTESIDKLPDEVRPRRLVVFIDEFTSLIEKSSVPKTPMDDPDLEEERQLLLLENSFKDTIGSLAGKITREARSAGVSLVLGGQKLRQDDLAKIGGLGSLKTNLARLLVGATTSGDRMSALRRAEEAPIFPGAIPPGRGIYEPSTGMPHTVQVAFTDTAVMGAKIAQEREPVVPVDLSPFIQVRKDRGPAVEDIDLDEAWDLEDEIELDLGDLENAVEIELDLDDFADEASEAAEALDGQPVTDQPGLEQEAASEPASPVSEPETDDAWDVFGASEPVETETDDDLWSIDAPDARPDNKPEPADDGWDFGEDPVEQVVKDVVNDVDLADADDEDWDFVSEPVARPAPKPVNADDWNFGDVPGPVSVPANTADEWSF